MRVAIVDIGSNSTRLLAADVSDDGAVSELARRSTVTRLGDGVDATGRLSEAAIERVMATLAIYVEEMEALGCKANMAVLTSAVRDADNGACFSEMARGLGLDARVLSGNEEAQLMFLGAMSGRPPCEEPTVVIDVGGGSTEFVVGKDSVLSFHVSVQAGVVRMSERHIASDPPRRSELNALSADARKTFLGGLPNDVRSSVRRGIAVAGTATSAAAIDEGLDPYDANRVHGYRLELWAIEQLLERLASMDEAARRRVVGLQKDRAPTIVAGMILLEEALRALGLEEVEVSEHDILIGGALRLAGLG